MGAAHDTVATLVVLNVHNCCLNSVDLYEYILCGLVGTEEMWIQLFSYYVHILYVIPFLQHFIMLVFVYLTYLYCI